jgi:bifunctional DNA-binding transcriptional regulator/antitoxin component of YhaV-PrlF toxin-antitoxin module
MEDELTTTLTERGQVSFPSRLRKKANLHTGQKLRWAQVSPTEFRISLVEEIRDKPDPFKAIGYARKFHPEDTRTTDEIMAELREGEQN